MWNHQYPSHRAFRISDKEHIEQELKHLENVFKENGYSKKEFDKVVIRTKRRSNTRSIDENKEGKSIILPYIKGTTDKIAKNYEEGKH
jgi:tRNA C32,U32 (ribose-2'-O)-methylase TrmJ